MDLLKRTNYRSNKILKAAKSCPYCMMCDRPNDGTIVAAHYQGYRQHSLGKGTGTKPTDSATAFICHTCHDKMDGRLTSTCRNEVDHSESFLFAIVKTHDWLLREGVLK